MLRLVQLSHPAHGRRVAVVEEPRLRVLTAASVYQLAETAIARGQRLQEAIGGETTNQVLEYELVYRCNSDWKLLPPIDHLQPSRCFITGTGLTHKASAQNRQSMHGDAASMTDSMKMYRIGVEGGRPQPQCIGAPPEWFYKGVGTSVRAHGEPLDLPNHADDGGDEAEIAGVYIISPHGLPLRVGFAQGNEFSDHVLEAKNYLYLAQSKLRSCSLGPELVIGGDFSDVPGVATIERADKIIWTAALASGEKWMCHSLANLEHHHFKHAEHRRAGDVHVHFFGADMFSFKDRLRLEDGDVMTVSFRGFGRPLRNPIHIDRSPQTLVTVKPL
jgi:hypothetical protein